MPNKRVFVSEEDLKKLKEISKNSEAWTEKPSLEFLLGEAMKEGVADLWNSYSAEGAR